MCEAEVLRSTSGAAEHFVLLVGGDRPQRFSHCPGSCASQGPQKEFGVRVEDMGDGVLVLCFMCTFSSLKVPNI